MSKIIDFLLDLELKPESQTQFQQNPSQTMGQADLTLEQQRIINRSALSAPNQADRPGLALDAFAAVNSSYFFFDPGPDPTPDPDVPNSPSL